MSYWQAMRYIILPQAVRRVLPPLGNDFIAMLKDSSLVSVLGVQDITLLGKVYCSALSAFFRNLQRRGLSLPGHDDWGASRSSCAIWKETGPRGRARRQQTASALSNRAAAMNAKSARSVAAAPGIQVRQFQIWLGFDHRDHKRERLPIGV